MGHIAILARICSAIDCLVPYYFTLHQMTVDLSLTGLTCNCKVEIDLSVVVRSADVVPGLVPARPIEDVVDMTIRADLDLFAMTSLDPYDEETRVLVSIRDVTVDLQLIAFGRCNGRQVHLDRILTTHTHCNAPLQARIRI